MCCLWSYISKVLGTGHRLSQGKRRFNLCTAFKGPFSFWYHLTLSVCVIPQPLRCMCMFMYVNNILQDFFPSEVYYFWCQVLLDDGRGERVILAHGSGLEASQEAITEYRVLGPMINGCSWIELRSYTSRKHQVHSQVMLISRAPDFFFFM